MVCEIQRIQIPVSRIIADIFPDAVQFMIVADDVFPVIALPDVMDICVLTHPFRDADFETTKDGTNGFGCAMWPVL